MEKVTLGIVVGNRGFFPAHLCDTGRKQILATLEKNGVNAITLPTDATKFGAVESMDAAKIDGILVTLPNFGDERGVANAIRWSGLHLPILVHAFNDDPKIMTIKDRRDSFCGKMSVCNNLRQYKVPFTLTRLHTDKPDSQTFIQDLEDFVVTCRTVKALKNLRIGALGARPTAFNTVRYSEKLLEASGISVETLDLSEVMGRIGRMKDTDESALRKLSAIEKYVSTNQVPREALLKWQNSAPWSTTG